MKKNLMNPIALREAVIKAIIHNDFTTEFPHLFEIFSDRITITSYGGLLYKQCKEEFFDGGSMPRNRELMRVFKDIGLVEQLGSGMNRILNVYSRDVFHFYEHIIKVNFPIESSLIGTSNSSSFSSSLTFNQTQKNILILIRENENITQKELAENLNMTDRTVRKAMIPLISNGMIKRVGTNRKGYWTIDHIFNNSSSKSTPNSSVLSSSFIINKTQIKIVELLKGNMRLTQKELAMELNLSERVIRKSMVDLTNKAIIKRKGSNRNGIWVINKDMLE